MDTWAGYIAMEVREGHVKEARSLYKRCHAKQLQDNGHLVLCQAWQRFEREHGSPEDHFQACLKTDPLLSKVSLAVHCHLCSASALIYNTLQVQAGDGCLPCKGEILCPRAHLCSKDRLE